MKQKLNTERFSGIFQVPDIYPICVVGAGGIGADAIITAGKMGFREIVVYDGDTVDDVNIATQFHRFADIGRNKAVAIGDVVNEFSGRAVISRGSNFDALTRLAFPVEVLISAVDSITARQDIWQAVAHNHVQGMGPRWYIDCRMAAMEFHMFVIDLLDRRVVGNYAADLMKLREDDIEELSCTEKATTFLAKISAGHIGAELMHIVKGEAISRMLIHNVNTQFLYVNPL